MAEFAKIFDARSYFDAAPVTTGEDGELNQRAQVALSKLPSDIGQRFAADVTKYPNWEELPQHLRDIILTAEAGGTPEYKVVDGPSANDGTVNASGG